MPALPYEPRHAASLGPATAAAAAAADAEQGPQAAPATGDDSASESNRKAARIAALFGRPNRVRTIAVGAIGIGITIFIASSLAAAAGHQHRTQAAAPSVHTAGPALPATPPAPAQAGAANALAAIAATPVRSTHKAPATAQVITGLAANGIPNVALNAYRVAAARMAHALPSCGIDWAMLAGIGREESDHGRFAGAVLHPDGTSTPQIVGPALDGTHSDYIAAPADGVALDGDAKYTHALGPMQFIPQTWAAYGADANGDGRADIFNINDAALGAARYLCANGGNLRTQAGRIAAVLAYNHNDEYVAQVLALAEAYRTGITISSVPVGQLFGALPPITPGPPLAVNPGAPTAVDPTYRHHRPATGATRPGTTATGGTRQGTASGSGTGSQPGSGTGSQPGTQPGSGSGSKPGGTASAPAPSPSPTSGGIGPVQVPVVPGPNPSATPSPAPSPTCHLGLAGTCVLP